MFNIHVVKAGTFYSDAGASFGNLPRAIWGRFLSIDQNHRFKLNLNLLLIDTGERVFLIDTGIGNKLTDKEQRIFSPEDNNLEQALLKLGYSPQAITDVIMTHLHHDHAGGIVSFNQDKKAYLTLPQACYHIQKNEWQMAKFPDSLNRPAYDYNRNLSLLEQQGKLNLIDGDCQLTDGIHLKLVGGHSEGMQIVIINKSGLKLIYPGDIIPSETFLQVPVTSAYDVCRRDTVKAKEWIISQMNTKGYRLIFDHSTQEVFYG